MNTVRIALVGNYHPKVIAHQAIPPALELAGRSLGISVVAEWLPTESLADAAPARFDGFNGIWCVPASPYKSEVGAIKAIRIAREQRRPFLGTCGGFQHALLEYARNVVGLTQVGHAENDPGAAEQLIAPLACAMIEDAGEVHIIPGTRLAGAYGAAIAIETYHCRYGLNPRFEALLDSGMLRVTARDAGGEVRAVELDGHPFFVATLFQPERVALTGRAHPLINAFVAACASA
jgi:CTP synthase (UTP-ammonia lyase)